MIGAWHRPEQAVSAEVSNSVEVEVDEVMIVFGADTHKRSHTIAAVGAASGELLGEQTVPSGAKGSAGTVALGAWLGRRAGLGA